MRSALSKRLASLEAQQQTAEPLHMFIIGFGHEPKVVTGYSWGDEQIDRLPDESIEELQQRAIDTASLNPSTQESKYLRLFFECTQSDDELTSEKP